MPEPRVALITGASRGIGEATALAFAEKGYNVAITATDAATLQAVADKIRSHGGKVVAFAGDLADLQFAESFVTQSVKSLGEPDVLVNNAAWRELVSMREISLESWEKTLRICLTTPAFLARWVASRMEPLRRGVIINVSSIMSQHPFGLAPAYIAAKGAMDALTYDLAALYGPSSIRVIAVNPGAIDTALSANLSAKPDEASAVREFSEEMISLRRWGKPEEIARTIVWLSGDDAAYITGTTIVADGGWSHQLYPVGLKRGMRPGQFR
jgi:NAD(P)-dependent dehydrogenase (short-subunit alcohol dehydrogenase family)